MRIVLILSVSLNCIYTAASTAWDYHTSSDTHIETCGTEAAESTTIKRCPQNLWQEGKGFAECGGDDQSPINIVADPVPYPHAIALELQSKGCPAANFQVNQHTADVHYPPSCAKSFSANWAGKTYYLLQLHYHSPSEHTLDGRYFAMEAHHVHKSKTGDVLVLAVFMTVDGSISKSLCADMSTHAAQSPECQRAKFFDNVLTFGAGSQAAALAQVNQVEAFSTYSVEHVPQTTVDNDAYRGFIPPIPGYVLHYMGSFTTPPCTTGVTWILHPEPVAIFEESLQFYRTVINAIPNNQLAPRPMPNFVKPIPKWDINQNTNNRDIQPLGHRDIYKISTEVEAYTSLTQATQIGATVLEVAGTRGFKIGHEIVVSNGIEVEKRKIVSIGDMSLTVDESLNKIHAQETAVTMPSAASTWDYTTSPNGTSTCGASTVDRCGQNIWNMGPGNAACSGPVHDQSPINAKFSEPVPYPETVHFKLVSQPCETTRFILNEHTLEVKLHGTCAHKSAAMWKGKSYHLQSFHYHSPSEHTVDGSYYVMEAQHVHQANDGEHLVLAVFMTLNPQVSESHCAANPSIECERAQFFDKILSFGQSSPLDAMEFFRARKAKREIHLDVAEALVPNDAYNRFVPPVSSGFVYHYMGSFTTPPCTAGVQWILHPQIVGIFSSSLDFYRNALSTLQSSQLAVQHSRPHFVDYVRHWDTHLGTNNRHIQELGGRSFFKAAVDTARPMPRAEGGHTTTPGHTSTPSGTGTPSLNGHGHTEHAHVKLYGVVTDKKEARASRYVWISAGVLIGWTSLITMKHVRSRYHIPVVSEMMSSRNFMSTRQAVSAEDDGDDREAPMMQGDTE